MTSVEGPQADLPVGEIVADAVRTAEVAHEFGPLPERRFLDRELYWLAFK